MTLPAVSLAPYPAIAESIATRLAAGRAGDPLAPWMEDVVVASSGMAHAISRALLARIPNGVAALHLQSIDVLARRIVNAAGEYPRLPTEVERRLAMRTAARMIDDPLTESRGAAAMLERSYRDVRDSGTTVAEFAQRVRRAKKLRNPERIRLLIRVWQSYERLIEKLGAIDAADLLGRAATLAGSVPLPPQILAGFYDMTGAQLALVEALHRAGKLPAIFIPFDTSRPEAYRFAQPFVDRFGAADTPRLESTAGIPRWTVRQEATREAEIGAVCASVRALLDDGVPPQSIGIVVRALDPYDAHLLDRFARQRGFATTAARSSSLAAHRFGRALLLLLRIRERSFPRGEVLEIVRSGLHMRTHMNADAADMQTRQKQIAGGTSGALRDRQVDSPVIGDYIDTVAELEELTANISIRSIQEIVDRFRPATQADLDALDGLQQIVGVFRRAEAWRRPFDPNAFIDAIQGSTISVAAVTPAADGAATGSSGATAGSIWAGDVMTFRGRSFEHLFVIRMQDDVLPQRRVEDPLLVDADRRLLGIREIGDGRAEEQLLFQLMCGGGASTHFSLAASDGFGKPLRPSQLLKQFAIEQVPGQRENILKNRLTGLPGVRGFEDSRIRGFEDSGIRGSGDSGIRGFEDSRIGAVGGNATASNPRNPESSHPRVPASSDPCVPASSNPRILASSHPRTRPLQLLARAGTQGAFDGYLRSEAVLEKTAAALQSISPTQLEDFGECPQKFFLKHILGVRDLEDPEMEMQLNARDKGTVNHLILENFYRRTTAEEIFEAARSLPVLPASIVKRLDEAVEEAFDQLDVTQPAFNPAMRLIERRATRRTLRHFIAGDIADLSEKGLTPHHFEYRFGASRHRRETLPDHEEAFVLDVRGIPLRVEGMIDRIDVTAGPASTSSVLRIVDYKSGKAMRHKKLADKIDRGVRLQLPLYAMAAAEFFATPPERISGAIKPLAAGIKAADYEFELGEKSARLRETLDIFAAAILRGNFPAFPNEGERDSDFNSCKYCPVSHSCRTRHDADESRAVLRAGEPRTLLAEERP